MIQYFATRGEIHRHGDTDARNHRRMRPSFAQIFQRHIAPKAEPDQGDPVIRPRRMPNHGRQIVRVPAVIKPQ